MRETAELGNSLLGCIERAANAKDLTLWNRTPASRVDNGESDRCGTNSQRLRAVHAAVVKWRRSSLAKIRADQHSCSRIATGRASTKKPKFSAGAAQLLQKRQQRGSKRLPPARVYKLHKKELLRDKPDTAYAQTLHHKPQHPLWLAVLERYHGISLPQLIADGSWRDYVQRSISIPSAFRIFGHSQSEGLRRAATIKVAAAKSARPVCAPSSLPLLYPG